MMEGILPAALILQKEKVSFSARSPLRYPGGKTRAVETITSFFPKDLKQMISPFFGGGSVELASAAKGTEIIGFDVFKPLVEFWQCLLQEPGALAAEVEKHYPLLKKDFYRLQKEQTYSKIKLERAAIYYVLNRSSFSGATLFIAFGKLSDFFRAFRR